MPLTPAYNRHAARVDARYLLGLLVLPTGAIRSSGAPPSSLRRPAEGPAVTPNIVDLHRWWRVKGSPTQMYAFMEGHAPRGSSMAGFGSSNQRGVVQMRFVTFSWPSVGGVLSQRWLVVEVAPLSHGYTGVRADAQDIWLEPKAASERVPAQARVLTVGEAFPARKPMLAFTTENAAKVHEIATMVNNLPVVQPGMVNCPNIPVGPTVTFVFRARRGGQVLAWASVLATGAGGECPGIYFTVHGRPQPSLAAQPDFLHKAQRVLGVMLPSK
ncbi:MAG: hypothetical protein JO342_01455 [Solirubrobacterales bacterium]|nr:hypothetical protein [Solirubrobacterales bacterium]